MLKPTDLLDERGNLKQGVPGNEADIFYYSVLSNHDRLTWEYRYIILWCLIKILFAAWEDSEITTAFRHHISYLFDGVQDFYLSLLFFVMHNANGKIRDGSPPLRFEAFHFFYSSHLPFFLSSQGENPQHHRSLSHMILGDTKFIFPGGINKREVTAQFMMLKTKVRDFWSLHFCRLSNFIYDEGREETPHKYFFCSPRSAAAMSDACSRIDLDVQSFKDYFTSYPGYWFHFKSITMPRVERDCKLYFDQATIPFVKRVWAQWYAHLCTCVNALGGNDHRGQGGVGAGMPVRSRFFRTRRAPSSLTAAILQSLAPPSTRWRVVVG